MTPHKASFENAAASTSYVLRQLTAELEGDSVGVLCEDAEIEFEADKLRDTELVVVFEDDEELDGTLETLPVTVESDERDEDAVCDLDDEGEEETDGEIVGGADVVASADNVPVAEGEEERDGGVDTVDEAVAAPESDGRAVGSVADAVDEEEAVDRSDVVERAVGNVGEDDAEGESDMVDAADCVAVTDAAGEIDDDCLCGRVTIELVVGEID